MFALTRFFDFFFFTANFPFACGLGVPIVFVECCSFTHKLSHGIISFLVLTHFITNQICFTASFPFACDIWFSIVFIECCNCIQFLSLYIYYINRTRERDNLYVKLQHSTNTMGTPRPHANGKFAVKKIKCLKK